MGAVRVEEAGWLDSAWVGLFPQGGKKIIDICDLRFLICHTGWWDTTRSGRTLANLEFKSQGADRRSLPPLRLFQLSIRIAPLSDPRVPNQEESSCQP